MIGFLAHLLISKGLPAGIAKPLAWAALIFVAISLISIGKCSYDRSLVRRHDAAQEAAAVAENAAANEAAAKSRRADDAQINQQQKELEDARSQPTYDQRRLARGCAILRQQGVLEHRLPERCRSDSAR